MPLNLLLRALPDLCYIVPKAIYEKTLQKDHYNYQFTEDYDRATNMFPNRKNRIGRASA